MVVMIKCEYAHNLRDIPGLPLANSIAQEEDEVACLRCIRLPFNHHLHRARQFVMEVAILIERAFNFYSFIPCYGLYLLLGCLVIPGVINIHGVGNLNITGLGPSIDRKYYDNFHLNATRT